MHKQTHMFRIVGGSRHEAHNQEHRTAEQRNDCFSSHIRGKNMHKKTRAEWPQISVAQPKTWKLCRILRISKNIQSNKQTTLNRAASCSQWTLQFTRFDGHWTYERKTKKKISEIVHVRFHSSKWNGELCAESIWINETIICWCYRSASLNYTENTTSQWTDHRKKKQNKLNSTEQHHLTWYVTCELTIIIMYIYSFVPRPGGQQ